MSAVQGHNFHPLGAVADSLPMPVLFASSSWPDTSACAEPHPLLPYLPARLRCTSPPPHWPLHVGLTKVGKSVEPNPQLKMMLYIMRS